MDPSMDPSMGQLDDGSDSPTQVNEGRSYDQYVEDPASLPSTAIRQTQEQGGFGDDFLARSLHENESGAVNFDALYLGGTEIESPTARESQDGWRTTDNDPVSTTAGTTVGPEPETPVAPRNPFAGTFQTPIVAGSQLFAQTPLSAVFVQASPTSSRPSPSGLPVQTAITPHTGESSLLRPRFPNSTRDELQTPRPMPMFHNLTTSSQSHLETTTPYPGEPGEPGEPTAPDSSQQPSSPTTRRRRVPAPLQEYEPMKKKSQERGEAASGSRPRLGSFNSSSDDDADTTSQRRRRAIVHQNKQEATKILSAISLSGPTFRDDIVEVPASTHKEEQLRSKGKELSPESDPQAAVSELMPTATVKPFDGPRSSVPESEYGHLSFPQSMIDAEYSAKPLLATKTPSSSAISLPELSETVRKQARQARHPHSSINEADAIPETSPARFRASARMQSPIHITSDTAEAPSIPPSADSDLLSSPARLDPPPLLARARQSQHDRMSHVIALLEQGAHKETPQDTDAGEYATSSPPVPLPETFNPKKRRRQDDSRDISNRMPTRAASTSSGMSAASSLSSLSVTPTQVTRAGTPITANDSDRSTRTSDKKDGVAEAPTIPGVEAVGVIDDSPILPQRRRRHDGLVLPAMKHDTSTYTKASAAVSATSMKRGLSPYPSGSTDDLAASLASFATGSERRTRSTRKFARSTSARNAALASTSHRRASAAPGLFAGMLFSVTFQSRRKGESEADYSKREKQGEKLQARILEEGGSILPDGFDALFQAPQMAAPPLLVLSTGTFSSRYRADPDTANNAKSGLRLLPHAAGTGFTALISDGHSRKAKYMQALALGLPCLAPRWVTACLERNELVDWSSYLLCAGESSYLGGAIRSRSLVSYDAYAARLVDMVESRSKLLEGLNILVFLRKSTREAYIFLAHVLGASLSRAHSPQEAREYLRAMEDAGRPFDWVYTDDEAEINSIFQDRASRPAAKRRKRQSSAVATHTDTDRPLAAVKLLSDERFIQSLIFGRLIEEDDLGD